MNILTSWDKFYLNDWCILSKTLNKDGKPQYHCTVMSYPNLKQVVWTQNLKLSQNNISNKEASTILLTPVIFFIKSSHLSLLLFCFVHCSLPLHSYHKKIILVLPWKRCTSWQISELWSPENGMGSLYRAVGVAKLLMSCVQGQPLCHYMWWAHTVLAKMPQDWLLKAHPSRRFKTLHGSM